MGNGDGDRDGNGDGDKDWILMELGMRMLREMVLVMRVGMEMGVQ